MPKGKSPSKKVGLRVRRAAMRSAIFEAITGASPKMRRALGEALLETSAEVLGQIMGFDPKTAVTVFSRPFVQLVAMISQHAEAHKTSFDDAVEAFMRNHYTPQPVMWN